MLVVVPRGTAAAPLMDAHRRYSIAPFTPVHENVTGELRFIAPFAGAIGCGPEVMAGHPLVAPAAVKRECSEDKPVQFWVVATTHHSTGPPGTLALYSLSRVTAIVLGVPPLNEAMS